MGDSICAQVKVLQGPWDGSADVGLIPSADLAQWAESGKLAETPVDLKSTTNSYRWDDLLPVYSVRLTNWRERTYALPVIAEGMVLAYRKDAFDGKDGRPSVPPSSWDELLKVAQQLGKNSLPPLPADAERLGAEFFSASASYDRAAVGRIAAGELIGEDFFTFQFDPATGKPRLNGPAFRYVADLFRQMQPFRGGAVDAPTAFRSGEAKVGILSLSELALLGAEMQDRVGVAPVPGATSVFDREGRLRPNDQNVVNRVPYLGWGGRLGVVSAKSTNLAAAWNFLAEVGSPDRTRLI